MFRLRKRNQKCVKCRGRLLFEIIEDDIANGLCADIIFIGDNHKHRIGAYGDFGNTISNTKFYFDKNEFNSFEQLKMNAMIKNVRLIDYTEPIMVIECDGCYPESTPKLRDLMK